MPATPQPMSTAPYTFWVHQIVNNASSWVDIPKDLQWSRDPLALTTRTHGENGDADGAEAGIVSFADDSRLHMIDHVRTTADSVSSSDGHDYDDDDEYDKVLREFIREEYFLPGPPSSAPFSVTPPLEQEIHPFPAHANTDDGATGNYTEIDRSFHEAEDASSSSSMPSIHRSQAPFLHTQDHKAGTTASNDCPPLHNGEPGRLNIYRSDRAFTASQTGSEIALGNFNERNNQQDDTRDGRQSAGPTTIAPLAPELLQLLVEIFCNQKQVQPGENKTAVGLSTPPPSSSITPVGLVNGWSPSSAQSSPPALSDSKATHPADPICINTPSPGLALSPAGSSSQQQKRKKEEDEQTPAPAPKKLKRPGKGQSAGPPTTQAVFTPVLHPKCLRQVLNYSSVPRGRPTDIFRIQTGQPSRGDWMTEEDEEYLESRKGSSQ